MKSPDYTHYRGAGMRWDKPLGGTGRPKLLRFVAAALVAVCVLGCASVPHSGRRQFNMISDAEIKPVALQVYEQVLSKEPESKDARMKEIARRVVTRISSAAEKMDHPGFDWKVQLIERDTPNAFCLPGGLIGVHTGLFREVGTEAGLAAIVGHEVAHAVARHGQERRTQQRLVNGVLAFTGELVRKETGEITTAGKLLLGALGAGATVGVTLPYSRIHEFEADQIGQIYMAAAGYDPQESVRVWEKLSKFKKPPIPVWLSTHPSDEERLRKLRDFLPDAEKYYKESPVKYGKGVLL
ncbi:MAG: M48 family metallopeptidase [Thermodesulfobacteriota bacterium]